MIKFTKLGSASRGQLWVANVTPTVTVSYGWSYIASNDGSAFARNFGTSGVTFKVRVERRLDDTGDNYDMQDVVSLRIDTVRTYAEASKAASQYIRETGKAQAIDVAEAILIES